MDTDTLSFLHYSHSPHYTGATDKKFVGYDALQFSGAGSIDLKINGKSYLLTGSWFWFTFDGGYFTYHPHGKKGSWNHHHIAFTGPRREYWRESGLIFTEPQQVFEGGHWSERLQEIFDCINQHDTLENIRAINLLENLLIDLASLRRKETPEQLWVTHVKEYLRNFRGEKPDYGLLAISCNMSLSSLRQRFKELTGISPHRFFLNCRIARACDMLIKTQDSIKEIAARLGFKDVYFFTRQFRKINGLPPGEFRKTWS